MIGAAVSRDGLGSVFKEEDSGKNKRPHLHSNFVARKGRRGNNGFQLSTRSCSCRERSMTMSRRAHLSMIS